MKIIITERQQKLISEDEDRDFLVKKKIAKKELTKKFGDLTPVEDKRYPKSIFYVDKNNQTYLEYIKKPHYVFVDYHTIWLFLKEIFNLNYEQIQQVTKEWFKEHYNLEVKQVNVLNSKEEKSWENLKNR
jgi:hypothetical protein